MDQPSEFSNVHLATKSVFDSNPLMQVRPLHKPTYVSLEMISGFGAPISGSEAGNCGYDESRGPSGTVCGAAWSTQAKLVSLLSFRLVVSTAFGVGSRGPQSHKDLSVIRRIGFQQLLHCQEQPRKPVKTRKPGLLKNCVPFPRNLQGRISRNLKEENI